MELSSVTETTTSPSSTNVNGVHRETENPIRSHTESIETEGAESFERECANCHQLLSGPFCSACGQDSDSKLKYFWTVILHLLDDIFSFDSRASRTLWPLIFKPGFLTKEYFAGRRVHYVPPLRLYLFVSIVFFISLKFIVSTSDTNTNNVKHNISAIIQVPEVTKHLKGLEAKKSQLLIDKSAKDVALVDAEIIKFTDYLNELNRDNSLGNNAKLIKTTSKILTLEFDKIKSKVGLSEVDKAKYEKLLAKRLLLLTEPESEKIKDEDEGSISVSNNEDGTLSFDFLSDENNKKLDAFSKETAKKAEKVFESDTGPLVDQILGKLPQLMFVLLPLFAVILKLMFIFSNRLYMEHLTVALHSHSFIFISLLSLELIDFIHDYVEPHYGWLAEIIDYMSNGLLLWIPIYLFIMQKRIYKQGYFLTFIKYNIIGLVYITLMGITALVAVVWGLTAI